MSAIRKSIQKKSKKSQTSPLTQWYKRPNTIALIIAATFVALSIMYSHYIFQESHTVVGEVLSKGRGVGSSYNPHYTIHCLVGDTCLILNVRYNYYEKAQIGDFVEIIMSDKHPGHYRLNKRRGFFSKPTEMASFIESIQNANSVDSLSTSGY